jgi:hypothetical protein
VIDPGESAVTSPQAQQSPSQPPTPRTTPARGGSHTNACGLHRTWCVGQQGAMGAAGPTRWVTHCSARAVFHTTPRSPTACCPVPTASPLVILPAQAHAPHVATPPSDCCAALESAPRGGSRQWCSGIARPWRQQGPSGAQWAEKKQRKNDKITAPPVHVPPSGHHRARGVLPPVRVCSQATRGHPIILHFNGCAHCLRAVGVIVSGRQAHQGSDATPASPTFRGWSPLLPGTPCGLGCPGLPGCHRCVLAGLAGCCGCVQGDQEGARGAVQRSCR